MKINKICVTIDQETKVEVHIVEHYLEDSEIVIEGKNRNEGFVELFGHPKDLKKFVNNLKVAVDNALEGIELD